jgi:hypothetical protein
METLNQFATLLQQSMKKHINNGLKCQTVSYLAGVFKAAGNHFELSFVFPLQCCVCRAAASREHIAHRNQSSSYMCIPDLLSTCSFG